MKFSCYFCDLMKRLLEDNFHRSVNYKLAVATGTGHLPIQGLNCAIAAADLNNS